MYCASFTDTVIDHFNSPHNCKSMENADGIGCYGDADCGDSLKIFIKVKNDVIEDISFLVAGCVAAVASSSMTTELAKGKTIEEALKITDEDIAIALGGLPENKMHCSVLGAKALQNAIKDYQYQIVIREKFIK